MLRILSFFILVFFAVSCSEKSQLSKDWNKMLDENFGKKKSGNENSTADSVLSLEVVYNTEPKVNRQSPKPVTAFNSGDKRQDLVNFAKQYIGTRYSFACATPEDGFDCSGFLYYVFSHFGYNVPRSSREYEFFGREISINEARRGDLVLFTPTENDTTGERIGHIGILINENGMNSDFIHSSSGKANGVTVSSFRF